MFSVEENEENGEQEADNEVDEEEEEGGEEEEEEEEGDGEYPYLSILGVLFPGLWHRGRVGGSQSGGCGPPATGLVPVEFRPSLFWASDVKCAPHTQSWRALSTHRCGSVL